MVAAIDLCDGLCWTANLSQTTGVGVWFLRLLHVCCQAFTTGDFGGWWGGNTDNTAARKKKTFSSTKKLFFPAQLNTSHLGAA